MVRRTSKKDEKIVRSGVVTYRQAEYERDFGDFEHCPGCNIVDLNEFYPSLTLKVTGRCAICYSHLTKEYPMDYPDEWKFCCICKSIADEIIKGNLMGFLQFRDQADRIERKITLRW